MPRVSGDFKVEAYGHGAVDPFAPRTRGFQCVVADRIYDDAVCPAYAGIANMRRHASEIVSSLRNILSHYWTNANSFGTPKLCVCPTTGNNSTTTGSAKSPKKAGFSSLNASDNHRGQSYTKFAVPPYPPSFTYDNRTLSRLIWRYHYENI